MSELPSGTSDETIARAGRYYRNVRYLIATAVLAVGIWLAYDGWVNWPNQVKKFQNMSEAQQAATQKPHSDLDITMQRVLALVLIPLAPVLLQFFLYRSRDEYRLKDGTLFVPGHPPVPFDAITAIDRTKWKRKGILYVEYQLPGGEAGRLTLDDFIYQQVPTDRIVEKIEEFMGPEEPEAVDGAEEPAEEIQDNDA